MAFLTKAYAPTRDFPRELKLGRATLLERELRDEREFAEAVKLWKQAFHSLCGNFAVLLDSPDRV